MKPHDDFVVVEVGTNHPGELEALCAIVQPDAGVITSIGHEHMEFFRSLEGVAAEEATLLDYIAPHGLAVVPGDEPLLAPHLAKLAAGGSFPPLAPVLRGEGKPSRCDGAGEGLLSTPQTPDPSPAPSRFHRDGLPSPRSGQRGEGEDGTTATLNLVRFGSSPDCSPRLLHCELNIDQHGTCGSRATFIGDGAAGASPDPQTFFLPLPGAHNARNALAAIAVGRWMGMDIPEITAALAKATGVSLRMEVRRIPSANVVLLTDCYNANPDSVAAALATLADYPVEPSARVPLAGRSAALGGAADQCSSARPARVGSDDSAGPWHPHASPAHSRRRVAILGDMLELGDQAPDLHRKVGAQLSAHPHIDTAILIGKLSLLTAEVVQRTWPPDAPDAASRVTAFPEWNADLPAKVAALLQPGDVVLIKASRGIGLERLLPAIERRFSVQEAKK